VSRHHRLTRRVKGHHHHKIGEVSANTPVVRRPEGSPPGLQSRRLGPTPSPNKEGQTQVDPTVELDDHLIHNVRPEGVVNYTSTQL
jgi:hypothetical protein